MHVIYVKGTLYIFINIPRCMVYMWREHYIHLEIYQDARYVCEGKLYVYKCIKMHGIYVKGTLYIFINILRCTVCTWRENCVCVYKDIYIYIYMCVYEDARYICEGKSTYLHYKCNMMHGIYVKGTLCIYVNVSRCTVCMWRLNYKYI